MQLVTAAEFKAKCLKLIEQVATTHEELIITKRGIPMAKMIPLNRSQNPFGALKNTVIIKNDIVSASTHEKWDSDE